MKYTTACVLKPTKVSHRSNMGRKGWPTDRQQVWLVERISAYRDARREKKLSHFYQRMAAAFYQTFPEAFVGQGDGDYVNCRDERDKGKPLMLNVEAAQIVSTLLSFNKFQT